MKRRRFLQSATAAAGWMASARATDAAPKPAAPEIAWSRRIPVRHEADVAVIGGGMAAKKGCALRDLDPAAVRKAVEGRGAELAVGKARKGGTT